MKEFIIKASNLYLMQLYIKEVVRKMSFCENWALLSKNGKIIAKAIDAVNADRKTIEDIYSQKDEDGNVVTRITTDEQGREVSVPLWIDDAAYEREIKEIINKDVTIELHEVNVTGFKWPDTDVCREALDYMSDTFVTLHEGQIKPAQVPGKRNKVRPIKS